MASEAVALRAIAGVPSGARYHRRSFGPVLRTLSGLRPAWLLAPVGVGAATPPPYGSRRDHRNQDHSSEGVQAQVWWVLRSKLAGRARLLRSTTGDPQSTPEPATLFGVDGRRAAARVTLCLRCG